MYIVRRETDRGFAICTMNCIFDQRERELKYNQVELKKFTLFLIVHFLDWIGLPKFIVKNVLIHFMVKGVRSNNLFREKRDPKKLSQL